MIDSYDIPVRAIPNGFIYQWADKEFMPTCVAAGWTPVPFDRHKDLFSPSCQQPDGTIKVEQNTLIERPLGEVNVQRAKEIEAAKENERKAAEKIEEVNDDGHISHIVDPAGMINKSPSPKPRCA